MSVDYLYPDREWRSKVLDLRSSFELAQQECRDYLNWRRQVMRDGEDEFTEALDSRYRPPALEAQQRLLTIITQACVLAHGVILSIDAHNMYVIERGRSRSGIWPVCWGIADSLKIFYGCGNGCQAQIDLGLIESLGHFPDLRGIYDLRSETPTRITSRTFNLHYFKLSEAAKGWNGEGDIVEYISSLNIDPQWKI